jgi:hypothetical protein
MARGCGGGSSSTGQQQAWAATRGKVRWRLARGRVRAASCPPVRAPALAIQPASVGVSWRCVVFLRALPTPPRRPVCVARGVRPRPLACVRL